MVLIEDEATPLEMEAMPVEVAAMPEEAAITVAIEAPPAVESILEGTSTISDCALADAST